MTQSIDTFLRVLNEACAQDPVAIRSLIAYRVPCNGELSFHPTIQVHEEMVVDHGFYLPNYSVGLLGIINGICEEVTGKRIAAKWSEPDEFGKSELLGFVEYDNGAS